MNVIFAEEDEVVNRPKTYQVNVMILEAKHLAVANAGTMVSLVVGGKRKKIKAKTWMTNRPFYNELCVFLFHLPLPVLLDKTLTILVYQLTKINTRSHLIGLCSMQLSTVWSQPGHQFYRKWAVLTNPSDPSGLVRGYLKCDVAVLNPGHVLKPQEDFGEGIEGHLLIPEGHSDERQQARFIFTVYRADGFNQGVSSGCCARSDNFDCCVKILFAEHTGHTSVQRNTTTPEWNEEFTFIESVPPLSPNVHIQLCDKRGAFLGFCNLDLNELSHEGEKGFLPTLGPTFLYLRQHYNKFGVTSYDTMLVGNCYTYLGRLLLSLKTEFQDHAESAHLVSKGKKRKEKPGMPKPVGSLNEPALFKYKEFILFTTIFDLQFLDTKFVGKNVIVQCTMGPKQSNDENEVVTKKDQLTGKGDLGQSKEIKQNPKKSVEKSPANHHHTSKEEAQKSESEDKKDKMQPIDAGAGHDEEQDKQTDDIGSGNDQRSKGINKVLQNIGWTENTCSCAEGGSCGLKFRLTKGEHGDDANEGKEPKDKTNLKDEGNKQKEPKEKTTTKDKVNYRNSPTAKTFADDKVHGPNAKTNEEGIKHVNVNNDYNATPPLKLHGMNKYPHALFSGIFPCVHVLGEWPQHSIGMFRNNVIQRAIADLTTGMKATQAELKSGNKKEATDRFRNASAGFADWCGKILDRSRVKDNYGSQLEKERCRVYELEVEKIMIEAKNDSKKKVSIVEKQLEKAEAHLQILKKYLNDPEVPFPDVEIWVFKDGACIGHHEVKAQDIMFSEVKEECGKWSGVIQPFLVKGKGQKIIAKVDLFLWLGLASQFDKCLNSLPAQYESIIGVDKVPTLLQYKEEHVFQCRAHLYQAKIYSGADTSGLADPYILVTVAGQHKRTNTKNATLNPIWDETLIFKRIVLWGSERFVKDFPQSAVIEVFDYDSDVKSEFIGRGVVKPVFKLHYEGYSPPLFPPKLHWVEMNIDEHESGKVLMAIEFLEVTKENENLFPTDDSKILNIPEDIRPHFREYQIEVAFWGIRELNDIHGKVMITIECAGELLNSPVIAAKSMNFAKSTSSILKVALPEEPEYSFPLTMKLYRTGSFGSTTYLASCFIDDVKIFNCPLLSEKERNIQIEFYRRRLEIIKKDMEDDSKLIHQKMLEAESGHVSLKHKLLGWLDVLEFGIASKFTGKGQYKAVPLRPMEAEKLDWWTKYNASTNDNFVGKVAKLKIYKEELEAQPEFNGFTEYFQSFQLTKGKGDKERSKIHVAKFKGAFKIYPLPLTSPSKTLEGLNAEDGVLSNLPWNDQVKVIVRVYVVRARMLTPKDVHGRADPFLRVTLGKQKASTRKQYISKQINPVFGKCFEFKATFPHDHKLRIQVLDYDACSKDDLIGETFIDLEDRYYSKTRAVCGLAKKYEETGYNAWRDALKPSEILELVAKQSNMGKPVYAESSVNIDSYSFSTSVSKEGKVREEVALNALHKWYEIPLQGFTVVPEHVETRSLYHPHMPGIEQGKLEMWVDIFSEKLGSRVPQPTNIAPKDAAPMELRVIVWNTDSVPTSDTSLFLDKMSDIFIVGWLTGPEDKQVTDVHYRSMTGEGNFNWRFIFPFDYAESENKMLVKKPVPFLKHPDEEKRPCLLELQVWDNDVIEDDFIGALSLDLCAMPNGSKMASSCNLKMLERGAARVNLFKLRRTRGWWPFRATTENDEKLAGRVELELEVLPAQEAKEKPAGQGREEPQPLPPPKRPESSFDMYLHPVKAIRFIICSSLGRRLCWFLFIAALILLVLVGLYSFPGYTVKRLLGA